MYRILSFLLVLSIWGCKTEQQRLTQVLALKHMQQTPVVERIVTQFLDSLPSTSSLTVQAHIIAGVDFSKLDSTAIQLADQKISIHLPKPKITSFEIDSSSLPQTREIMDQVYHTFRRSIDTVSIISEAETKTSKFLSTYLTSVGFSNVQIRFEDHN